MPAPSFPRMALPFGSREQGGMAANELNGSATSGVKPFDQPVQIPSIDRGGVSSEGWDDVAVFFIRAKWSGHVDLPFCASVLLPKPHRPLCLDE